MAAARHGFIDKVVLLCERHPHRLIPGLLPLMACLPETEPADSYATVLELVRPHYCVLDLIPLAL